MYIYIYMHVLLAGQGCNPIPISERRSGPTTRAWLQPEDYSWQSPGREIAAFASLSPPPRFQVGRSHFCCRKLGLTPSHGCPSLVLCEGFHLYSLYIVV